MQILRSPPSAPSRPATVCASSRPRDPGRARTPWGFGPEQVVFYGRGRLGRRWFPKPVQTGSIPVVRAILALSNGNDAALPGRRCGSDSRRGVHLSGSSNGRMPGYEPGDCRFESCPRGQPVVVAQSEEHRPPKPEVGGSSPPRDAMPQQLDRTSIPVLTGRVPVRSRPAVPSAVAARLDEQRASTPTAGGSSPPCGAIPSIPSSTPEESCSSASPSPAVSVPATSVASGPMPPGTGARSCATGQPMAPSAALAAYAGRPNRRPRVSARSYKPSKP